ncbi:MAG: 4Fe-4S dicluster domain-containing protein [Candidatus Eisenbacteria bacterium]|nr:4Fe-4S dicluster domain-containing protein [Candidatus Eisenbacteria bacterium]
MAVHLESRRFWRKPLDDADIRRTRGEVHILVERCKGCAYCVEYCPLDVLRMSSRFNRKGYHPPEIARADECVACRLCETLCPEFSIFITVPEGGGASAAESLIEEVLP